MTVWVWVAFFVYRVGAVFAEEPFHDRSQLSPHRLPLCPVDRDITANGFHEFTGDRSQSFISSI
nr:hypothetical protein [Leptolyngbya ohadii]